MSNKTRSKQEVNQILEKFEKSGLSVVDFCKQANIPQNTFRGWIFRKRNPLNPISPITTKSVNTTETRDYIKEIESLKVDIASLKVDLDNLEKSREHVVTTLRKVNDDLYLKNNIIQTHQSALDDKEKMIKEYVTVIQLLATKL